jgi:hypothetical protein
MRILVSSSAMSFILAYEALSTCGGSCATSPTARPGRGCWRTLTDLSVRAGRRKENSPARKGELTAAPTTRKGII